MGVYKCKTCGGELVIDFELSIAKCVNCGNIQSLFPLESEQPANAQPVTIVSEQIVANHASLTERAFMCLEDGDFSKADDFLEKALNMNPKYGLAHLGKLMIDLKVRDKKSLKDCDSIFNENNNYHRAVKYGDDALKLFLSECVTHIKEKTRNEYINKVFSKAKYDIQNASSEQHIDNAVFNFRNLIGNLDSGKKEKELYDNILNIARANKEKLKARKRAEYKSFLSDLYNHAKQDILKTGSENELEIIINDYKSKLRNLENDEDEITVYNSILNLKNSQLEKIHAIQADLNSKILSYEKLVEEFKDAKTIEDFNRLRHEFETLDNIKDSKSYVVECNNQINKLRLKKYVKFIVMIFIVVFIIRYFLIRHAHEQLNEFIKQIDIETVICEDGFPFAIGKYEVTQFQYESIMGNNPSGFKNANNPVENVSWYDAKAFCDKLNEKFSSKLPLGYKFNLPTETQWEFSCKSEDNKLDDIAWYISNSDNKTHPVGMKKANSLGIYDMQGNVWEWCLNSSGSKNNQKSSLRGGSYVSDSKMCNPFFKGSLKPETKDNNLGFRIGVFNLFF